MQVEVGTIFQGLYGNESSRFYQVVESTTKTVAVKEIEAVCTGCKSYTAHSEETRWMPAPDRFCNNPRWDRKANDEGKRCRVKESCPARPKVPCITVADGVWAVPWDGAAGIVDHYS